MKKSLFIILVMPFIFGFAHAQMTSEETALFLKQQAAQAQSEKAYADAQAGLTAGSDAISTWGSRVAKGLGSTWTDATTGIKNFSTRAFSSTEDIMNIDSQAHKDLLDRTQAANRAKLQASDAREAASGKVTSAIDSAKSAFSSATSAVGNKATAAYATAMGSAKDTAMSAYIKSVGLTASFASLSNRYSSVNDAMTVLERNMDRSILAAYMQEKMRKLLSSDVMCKAAASCKSGKNSAAITASDLKSVFPVSVEASAATTAPMTPQAIEAAAKAKSNK